ncbi:FUSC family protein [Methylobacterium soli]|uniref:FUSC family protein n=1 Tax=Methylobacterium soli TaxID=553447 RepID=A0A6L3T2A7_9HYPH|nr:FUSC family protein [Methylobacterium soli]KAB1080870.1 FUSC family protein [Methylobacterium soli]GJE45680.1 hypothetical protein AEGHOMDF_4880 [Methylobacterium soli]
MAQLASERLRSALRELLPLLAPFPGRLEFAARLGLICALSTLVAEIYQTPEPALAAYVAFFLIKPDRATSIVVSLAMTVILTVVISIVLVITIAVIDHPFWRLTAMTVVSFIFLFAASASKLKPIAGIVALIIGYALDLLGTAHGGDDTTRSLLYAWLFVGIPAGVSIVFNLVLGPAPRRLVEQALARRLLLAAAMLRDPDLSTRQAFAECLGEGTGEISAWLKMVGVEKTSSPLDTASLWQASQSTLIILSVIDFLTRDPEPILPNSLADRAAQTIGDMAAIMRMGAYPVDVTLEACGSEAQLTPVAAIAFSELRSALTAFAQPSAEASAAVKSADGFFLPDAFENPIHVQYALKTTVAAMFCYVVYSLLDWPGIHTCLITCYIVGLGTMAETIEKATLRFLGCLIGAVAGLATIVFLMPDVTSIGALMAVIFVAAITSGWVAAGSPRIAYIGFQLAFAFFLSVVQGAGPSFDMVTARDRLIGILFGNLVILIVFTLAPRVSIAARLDPAIAAVLGKLAALAAAESRSQRWAIAADVRTALTALEQDLKLSRYEPSSIRAEQAWLRRRRGVAHAISVLHAPVLIYADQDPGTLGSIPGRLSRIADTFNAPSASSEQAESSVTTPKADLAEAHVMHAVVEASLASLEWMADVSIRNRSERADQAPS